MTRATGELTFCFTDIEGSTALLNGLGAERYERVLGEHRQLLRAALTACDGDEVSTDGDGMFFAFRRAADALRGCADAQRALTAHDWPFGVIVRVRMGVHTGEAVNTADGDYIGLAVHQATRVAAAGHGGQIVVSPTTAEQAGDELPEGCALAALGEFHVRDFPAPVRLARLTSPGTPDIHPPLRLAAATPRNFAAMPNSFVGRDLDVASLRDLVGEHLLVTVVGPGGVGKSRLAREVAAQMTDGFADGVWLVELEGTDNPAPGAVAGTLAGTMGVTVAPGASPLDAVVDDLCERSRLVVLDACEGALDGTAAIVEAVTARRGASRFLATSREALSLRTEQCWPLAPLALPRSDGADPVAVVTNAAGRLFEDRARAVRPGFTVNDVNAAEVALVCRTLEGIPLALELAAARLSEVDITELAAGVQRVLELRGGYRTDPARHRTMRALVAWSAESLTDDQRAIYRRLAVLRSWSGRTAAAVAAAAGEHSPGVDVEAALSALVAKSILLTDDAGRVRMLDPVREHAAEELASCGEAPRVMNSLLRFACERGRIDPVSAGASLKERESADLSYDTLRSILLWARDADLIGMAQLITTMQVEFVLGARADEGLEWVDLALVVISEQDVALRAALLHVAGSITQTRGDGKRARDMAEQGLVASEQAIEARRLGLPTGADAAIDPVTSLVGAANTLGSSLLYERRLDEAEQMFDRAAAAVAPTSRAMLVINNNRASLCLARGDLAGAEAALRAAAEIAAVTYDPNGPQVRLNIAALRGIAGDHIGAAAEIEAGIEEAEALGVKQVLPMAVVNLGIARRNLADPRALETLRRGIRIAREQQNLMALAQGMRVLVDISRHEPAELRRAAEDLGAVASRIPDDATAAWAAAVVAAADVALGETDAARLARSQAITMARAAALPPADASQLLLDLANSLTSDAPEAAASLLGAADAMSPEGIPPQPAFTRVRDEVLARLRDALGDAVDARLAEGATLSVDDALTLAAS
ncbi:MAG TPA: adenylate/guanylate cyclase domain-containing protein [Acidimicrobiales bacterium]|nr:adenylate/guanylate cyclase domain-containing protein [Acidimicrobiales bacterium]